MYSMRQLYLMYLSKYITYKRVLSQVAYVTGIVQHYNHTLHVCNFGINLIGSFVYSKLSVRKLTCLQRKMHSLVLANGRYPCLVFFLFSTFPLFCLVFFISWEQKAKSLALRVLTAPAPWSFMEDVNQVCSVLLGWQAAHEDPRKVSLGQDTQWQHEQNSDAGSDPSKLKLGVAKLAKHDCQIHTLCHCRYSSIIGTIPWEPSLPWFLHFLYTPLELLMAFDIGHTMFLNTFIVDLTTSIKIIARFLSRASTPPYSTILPVPNIYCIAILSYTSFAASGLRIVGGFSDHWE